LFTATSHEQHVAAAAAVAAAGCRFTTTLKVKLNITFLKHHTSQTACKHPQARPVSFCCLLLLRAAAAAAAAAYPDKHAIVDLAQAQQLQDLLGLQRQTAIGWKVAAVGWKVPAA